MLSVKILKRFGAHAGRTADGEPGSGAPQSFTLDVEFAAAAGVSILFGASGSGKTLTLKAIAGLVRPDAGLIKDGARTLFDSERRIDLRVRERGAGYVFQDLALFPHLTAHENVEFPISHLPRRERRARAGALLERFGIAHIAARSPRNISGGEAQRVALARALAGSPRFLLLDEPLSALHESIKLEIIADLKQVTRELRLPVIYVTHSRDEALALGERALVYDGGRVVADGEPAEVFGAPVRTSVARLTGVENIFEGVVVKHDETTGTSHVQLEAEGRPGCTVEVPLGRKKTGERVTVAIRSGDVLLATEEPRRISARNILQGRVTCVEERSEQMLVRVESGVEWTASVTRQSVAELQLEAGRNVWLAFKTYSCRLLDED